MNDYNTYMEKVAQFGNIYFSIPGWHCYYKLYNSINTIRKRYPFIFVKGIKIDAIYDCPPSCIWNGGSFTFGQTLTKNQLIDICTFYKNILKVPIRLTFTNPVLTESDLKDRYGNMIAETVRLFEGNEALVSTDLMANYLSRQYPNLKLIRSIIGTKDAPYSENTLFKRTVLARRENNNFNLLHNIPETHRGNIEILCNEVCIPNCPYTYEHYANHGLDQLHYCTDSKGCKMTQICRDFRALNIQYRYNHLDLDDIFLTYLPLGYKHFKFSPRFDESFFIEEFARFFIREEYQQDFRVLVRKDLL